MVEVCSIAGSQTELVLDRGCCDESVGKAESALSSNPPSPFRYHPVDSDFPKWSKECAHQVGGGVAGKELGSGDDRVVDPVTAGSQFPGAAQVVDEDVGVDEKVSHDPIRRGWAP